jgi:hypothetical protein
MAFAEGCDSERLRLLRIALGSDAEPPLVDLKRVAIAETRSRSSASLSMWSDIAARRSGRRSAKADQTVELRLLLLCAKVRVVEVLLLSGRVDARRLQLR